MTTATLEKKISKIPNAKHRNPLYVALLQKRPPRKIETIKEHKDCLELTSVLMRILATDQNKNALDGIRRYLHVPRPT